MVSTAARTRTPLPPAVRTDLPVLVAVLAGVVTVGSVVAHRGAAVAILVAAVAHLGTRRAQAGRAVRVRLRGRRARARSVASWCVLLGLVAMTVTGVLRMAGVPREDAWHGGASWLFLAAVTVHLALVSDRLRARMRRRPATGGGTRRSA